MRTASQWCLRNAACAGTSATAFSLDILAPSLQLLADTGDVVNENSIIAMLQSRGFRELFVGDAGEASEARLLSCHPERSRGTAAIAGLTCDDLRADVLKAGHGNVDRRHQKTRRSYLSRSPLRPCFRVS
jgi:hypothetical protein